MKSKGSHVTLKDIALEMGITPAAVSRALRDADDISPATCERAQEIAKRLGYRVNVIARNLRTGISHVLGVLVPDNTDPYYASVIRGVEEAAKKRNYIVVLMNTNENAGNEAKALTTLQGLRIGGILSVPVDIGNYLGLHVPVVFLSRYMPEMEEDNFNYVINDDIKGVQHAIRHLLGRNRGEVFFINAPKEFYPASVRLDGFKRVLAEEGMKFSNRLVIFGDNSMEGGYKSCLRLLEYADPPFGIFCCSDEIAIGVSKAIKDKGLKIPENIGLVGYDDIEMLQYLDLPMTTIRQARYEIGAQGADIAINQIENSGDFRQKSRVVLEPELVVRQST